MSGAERAIAKYISACCAGRTDVRRSLGKETHLAEVWALGVHFRAAFRHDPCSKTSEPSRPRDAHMIVSLELEIWMNTCSCALISSWMHSVAKPIIERWMDDFAWPMFAIWMRPAQ